MGPGGLYSFILCMAALSVLHQYESFKRPNRVHIVLVTAGHVFVLVIRRTITNTPSSPGATINAITDRNGRRECRGQPPLHLPRARAGPEVKVKFSARLTQLWRDRGAEGPVPSPPHRAVCFSISY